MSLELVNTFGTLLTVAIIAATAIAAMVQLRHLRAGNQISAMLSIGESLNTPRFRDAVNLISRSLAAAMEDPRFRQYEAAMSRGQTPPDVDSRYVELRTAAIHVGNMHEELGLLVKNRIIDERLFLDAFSGVILGAWRRLENYTALGREAYGTDVPWENFEYATVLAQDWQMRHPNSYPKGVRRLQLHNPWPVPPMPATA